MTGGPAPNSAPAVPIRTCSPSAARPPVSKTLLTLLGSSVLAGLVGLAEPAAAATRAVVVGIDGYTNIRRLNGAENDAKDIAAVLRKHGVSDLRVILSNEATRDQVLGALDAMVDRAQKDDLVIFSIAGHGNSEVWGTERPKDAKQGDKYEVFLLRDFFQPDFEGRIPANKRKEAGERILGREFQARLLKLEQKGARAVFVADTCHGGGLTRQVVAGAPEPTYRASPPYPSHAAGEDPLSFLYPGLPPEFDHLKMLPSLTFLAAVDRNTKAPEVRLPAGASTYRGALSFAFARILEGAADTNRDGDVTREEIFQYIKPFVRQATESKQTPELQPSDQAPEVRGKTVIRLAADLGGAEATRPQTANRVVRIFVDGGAPIAPSRGRTGDLDITPARDKSDSDLVFVPGPGGRNGRVVTSTGDALSYDAPATDLPAIAEREIARRELLEIGRGRSIEMRLLDKKAGAAGAASDRTYKSGETVEVEATLPPGGSKHYLLFNIGFDGTVQFLYPIVGKDRIQLPPGPNTLANMDVQRPYGADMMVLITSDKPLTGLIGTIKALDGERLALDAVSAIRKSLTEDMTISTQSLFTVQQ